MPNLRSNLIHLAHQQPHLRESLLPLLRTGSRGPTDAQFIARCKSSLRNIQMWTARIEDAMSEYRTAPITSIMDQIESSAVQLQASAQQLVNVVQNFDEGY